MQEGTPEHIETPDGLPPYTVTSLYQGKSLCKKRRERAPCFFHVWCVFLISAEKNAVAMPKDLKNDQLYFLLFQKNTI